MEFLTALEADCRTLAARLRAGGVPRDRRRDARDVLQRVFVARGPADEPPTPEALAALVPLAREVDRLLGAPRRPWKPLGARLERFDPVRIRSAVRTGLVSRVTDTYGRIDARLAEAVEWFWKRCKPDEELARAPTIEEKAAAELSEDLEYVWGSKRPHG